jgi:hypothetical protein
MSVPQASLKRPIFALDHLPVNHEAQTLLEGERAGIGHLHLLLESAGHGSEPETRELLDDRMCQHSSSFLPEVE